MPDENNETKERKDENNNSDGELEDDWLVDSDTSDPLVDRDRLSVFCRNCLSLYEGEEIKDGNFVLRCTNCAHRDIIPMTDLQGTVYEREPHLLVGDLLYNRFNRILQAKEKMKEANVSDPDYLDDQYRKYYYLHLKLFEHMDTTIRDMNNVIDECRKQHNEKMIETIVDKRAKQLEEGLQDVDEKIEVVGTQENGTLVISPDEFHVPNCVKIKCFRMGKHGIRNTDKLMLEHGLPDKTIETMPLYQLRIHLYKTYMATAENRRNARRRNKNMHRRENADIADKSKHDCSESMSNGRLQNDIDEMWFTTNEETESKKKYKKKKSKSGRKRAEKSEQTTQFRKSPMRLSTEDYIESIPKQKPKPITPEEKKSFDEQYNLSKFVMEDIDEIADLNNFTIGKTNDAFAEITSALLKLREVCLEQRRVEAVEHIETTMSGMTGQVSVVRQEIIEELKNAYKSKMVRSLRQKRELQETTEQMEECGKILQSYRDLGIYDERLDELLDRVRKICREN